MKTRLIFDVLCFSVPDSAKETFSTLSNCSTTISSSCQVAEGTFNQTNLELCAEKFEAVKNKSGECYSLVTAQETPVSTEQVRLMILPPWCCPGSVSSLHLLLQGS